MKAQQSLCQNCNQMVGCTLRNGHRVLHCEEYSLGVVPITQSTHSPSAYGVYGRSMSGLCMTCDHVPDCHWPSQEAVIFQCEHYK